mmetsp:Transcript_7044/g.19936  ORF Transcript_7044/g.19936 Transcript_7044/m.19936 type:complete len:225 (+) Transcript_7044:1211-1885(+)
MVQGTFMKSSVWSVSSNSLYSTVKVHFGPAPPPRRTLTSSRDTIRVTALPTPRVPAAWKALVSQSGPRRQSSSQVLGISSPYLSPGKFLAMRAASSSTPFILRRGSKKFPGFTFPHILQEGRSESGMSGVSSTRTSGRVALTTKSFPSLSRKLTQPDSGPLPSSLSKCKRSPSSASSLTQAPVARRSGSAAESVSLARRTRMPPRSPPPTTLQTLGAMAPPSLA